MRDGLRPLISVVIPAYNEEAVVDELARRLQGVFEKLSAYDFEAIIVENGSADDTYARLLAIREADRRFKIVQLARNFATDGGITAGLTYARGDAAVIMTADLQDPPEMIESFLEKWQEGYENVYGIVTKRTGTGPIRRMNSLLFYWIMNKMTSGAYPRNVSDFRLVDRKVYETINTMGERNRFLRGMFFWTGFKSIGVEHERAPRFAGRSNAGTRRIVEFAIKSIFAYSHMPLWFITMMGITVSAFSFVLLIFFVVRTLFWGVPFPGFGTVMTVMLLMFGFLFTMLGIVAEYIGLVYDEVKQRPNFIVREENGCGADASTIDAPSADPRPGP